MEAKRRGSWPSKDDRGLPGGAQMKLRPKEQIYICKADRRPRGF